MVSTGRSFEEFLALQHAYRQKERKMGIKDATEMGNGCSCGVYDDSDSDDICSCKSGSEDSSG